MGTRLLVAIVILAAILAAVWFLFIRVPVVPIGEILGNPSKFEDEVIAIKGEVSGRMSFLGFKTYTLKDLTGEIRVITERNILPNVGGETKAKGRVEMAFEIAGISYIVLREEGS